MTDVETGIAQRVPEWQVRTIQLVERGNRQGTVSCISVPYESSRTRFRYYGLERQVPPSEIRNHLGVEPASVLNLGGDDAEDVPLSFRNRLTRRETRQATLSSEQLRKNEETAFNMIGRYIRLSVPDDVRGRDDLMRVLQDSLLSFPIALYGSPPNAWKSIAAIVGTGVGDSLWLGHTTLTQDPVLLVLEAGTAAFLYLAKPTIDVVREGVAQKVAKAMRFDQTDAGPGAPS